MRVSTERAQRYVTGSPSPVCVQAKRAEIPTIVRRLDRSERHSPPHERPGGNRRPLPSSGSAGSLYRESVRSCAARSAENDPQTVLGFAMTFLMLIPRLTAMEGDLA